jgi:hypothetical protein
MNSALFNYPRQAEFSRLLTKTKIYEYARPSRAVRDRFAEQISQIIWQYKLAPETINLPARAGVSEIQIIELVLKSGELSEELLRCIDKAIPFPIFFQLAFDGQIKVVAAYKRPSETIAVSPTDHSKWVIDGYFDSGWFPADSTRTALPVALDMAGLYDQMLRQLMPLPARTGESLKDQAERIAQIRRKQNECQKLDANLQREKQFNRKVEINAQLRSLKDELAALSNTEISR